MKVMYMCDVPCLHTPVSLSSAIEKAMVYLDTGELPWDMELFTFKVSEVAPVTHTPHRSPKKMESEEETTAEMNAFMEKLKKFLESRGEWDGLIRVGASI